MSQDTGKTDRTESRLGKRFATRPAPMSQSWLIPWQNPIGPKDRYDAVRKIPNLTRADKEVLRQLVTWSLYRCHAWIHFDALVRGCGVKLRQARASLKKLRSLYIVLTWTVPGERRLHFEINWSMVGRLCGMEFPTFRCPHRPASIEIPPERMNARKLASARRSGHSVGVTWRQLALPFVAPKLGAEAAPKTARRALNFSAETAPKNDRQAGQDQRRNCTEIGAASAPANNEEEAEHEAEAATTDAATDLVRRMTQVKPTYSVTVGRRLAEQHPESFRRVLAQVEAADDPEVYPDQRISWCIAHNELLSTPRGKPKRETDAAVADRLRRYGRTLPTCVERCTSLKLQERIRSVGYDGLTADEQAAARDADRRASP
jgi:hypothetical protein